VAAKPAGGGHPGASAGPLEQFLGAADALRRVTGLVARGASPAGLYSAVAQEVAQLLGADAGGMLRYEPGGTVAVAGWWGVSGMDVPLGTQLTVAGENVAASVLRNGQPARTDRFDGPAGSVAARFRELGVRSSIGAPITLEGRVWGVAVAATSRPGRLPADSEWHIAGLVALVGAAVADLHQIADEHAALRRVAMLVAGSAAPAVVFREVASEVRQLLDADVTTIARFEPDATATILADDYRAPTSSRSMLAQVTGTVGILAGLWVAISPWFLVLQHGGNNAAVTNLIVGLAVAGLGLFAVSGSRGFSGLELGTLLAGVWLILSPFILNATYDIATSMFWSNIFAGALIAVVGLAALGETWRVSAR
jgi:GAF domain-containing protein